jgi:oligosaccharide repeat unit polymerase
MFSNEKKVVTSIWIFVVILYILSIPIHNHIIGTQTIVIIFLFLLSFRLPLKNKITSIKCNKLNKIPQFIFCLGIFCFLLDVFLFKYIGTSDSLSDVRSINQESNGVREGIYNYILFFAPPKYICLILSLFSNNKRDKIVFITLSVLEFVLFLFISGGRVHLVVLMTILSAFYFFSKKKITMSTFFKGLLGFFILSIISVLFSISRIGEDDISLIYDSFSSLGYLNNINIKGDSELLTMVYVNIIITLDYTGFAIMNLDRFFINSDSLPSMNGFYQFNFLDRFGTQNFHFVHDKIDLLYYKYGITNNVWGTSIREMFVDFKYGFLLFNLLIAYLLFKSKQKLNWNSSKIIYILSFSYFIFSPFYSLFVIQSFGSTYIISLIWFFHDYLHKGRLISRA